MCIHICISEPVLSLVLFIYLFIRTEVKEMFFSEQTFEKYSLFGSFDSQLKKNAINQSESNFEVVPFLELCKRKTSTQTFRKFVFSFFFFNQQLSHSEEDTHWYNDLIRNTVEFIHFAFIIKNNNKVYNKTCEKRGRSYKEP